MESIKKASNLKSKAAASPWIPTAERLPEHDGPVLMWLSHLGIVVIGKFMQKRNIWVEYKKGSATAKKYVTHWAEIQRPVDLN